MSGLLDIAGAGAAVDMGDELDVATIEDVGESRFAAKPRSEGTAKPTATTGFKSRAAKRQAAAAPVAATTAESNATDGDGPQQQPQEARPQQPNPSTDQPKAVATSKPTAEPIAAHQTHTKVVVTKKSDGSDAQLKDFVGQLKAGAVSWAKRA